jgi:dolichol-phosphate mannosyltransferase
VTVPGTCTVVIPTYNEEKNIVNMAKAIRELYPDMQIMFMDDNSTDSSKRLIDELSDPRTRMVVRKPEERGLAASVFQGILECGTDYFMTIDCDFQHPPGALGDMYAEMEKGCDLCVGTRVDRFALGLVRWAGSWFFNVYADLYLLSKGKRLCEDLMSGLIAGRTDVFVPVIKDNWNELEMKGWKVLLDLLKFGPPDMKISKAKYRFGKRAQGESHINNRVVLTTFNQCGRFGKFCARVYSKLKGT